MSRHMSLRPVNLARLEMAFTMWILLFGGNCKRSLGMPNDDDVKIEAYCLAYLNRSSAVLGVILWRRKVWNCCQSMARDEGQD